ncbi:MAG: hypothetical protein K1X79_08650 [Oligoflexia bacterium]|nr:hypothetical protein [Oligoflexia bacterium]
MQTARDLKRQSEERWSGKLLRRDIEALQREHKHLMMKSNERVLSDWEISRVQELSRDLIRLMRQLLRKERSYQQL